MRIGELVGSGRTADVYAIDERWVLRRYRDGTDQTREAAVLAHLAERGYPVPAVDPASDAGRGLVMQRLYGPTMLGALTEGAIGADEAGAVLAELLHRLHAVPARFGAAPEHRILHLDLHPDNVILTPRGPMVIDWCNSTEGPPGLDWAMSALILAQAAVGLPDALAETARAVLRALLAGRGGAPDLGDPGAGPLARARQRRAADPTMSARELEQLDAAVALVAALGS